MNKKQLVLSFRLILWLIDPKERKKERKKESLRRTSQSFSARSIRAEEEQISKISKDHIKLHPKIDQLTDLLWLLAHCGHTLAEHSIRDSRDQITCREYPNTEFLHSYQISSLDDITEQELGQGVLLQGYIRTISHFIVIPNETLFWLFRFWMTKIWNLKNKATN